MVSFLTVPSPLPFRFAGCFGFFSPERSTSYRNRSALVAMILASRGGSMDASLQWGDRGRGPGRKT